MKKNYEIALQYADAKITIEDVVAITATDTAYWFYREVGEGVLPHALIPSEFVLYIKAI